jgi:hypothetical protein
MTVDNSVLDHQDCRCSPVALTSGVPPAHEWDSRSSWVDEFAERSGFVAANSAKPGVPHGAGKVREALLGRAAPGVHPQGARPLVAMSRTARSGQWRCLERAVGDAQRLERSFRDIGYVRKAPFATMPDAARPACAAGFARSAHLTGYINRKVVVPGSTTRTHLSGPWRVLPGHECVEGPS